MTHPRIGLALGGGAARGLAHIPVLEVFDELGIKPAVIAGTSMGAIIGAAYAGGMSGAALRDHAEKLLGKRIDMARHIFGAKKARIGELFSLSGVLSLHLQGTKLVDIALPDHLPHLIEDLPIPFKVVATDYENMEERVITSGPLIPAVAASIAIPGLIAAQDLNGRLHVDGGVTNPVPFDHVREECDVVVAIDVTGKPKPSPRGHPSNMEIAIGSLLIMFQQVAELRRALNPPDIYIRPPVEQFGAGEFFKAREIMQAADAVKDGLKRSLDLRISSAS
jgi:NTE family protein